MRRILNIKLVVATFCCVLLVSAQTGDTKTLSKDGLSFDYASAWQLEDRTNEDAQQFALMKSNSDVQITIFVHKGRVTPEKLPEAKKAFIDPYISATVRQLMTMGGKPEQTPDTSEIGGVKADGVVISAALGGEAGAAKIYWTLVGQRVVVLTIFGPDKQMKQLATAWDLVRTSLKVVDPKAAASPKPSP